MPQVVNGIGTWYYGRSNSHTIRSRCEFCNGVTELTSYDTTLYFVIVFIPIIPLGKKRILDACKACQKHRYVSLQEWEQMKKEQMTATLSELAASPNDPDALSAALATATKFQDPELFDRIAGFARTETENPKLQLLLGETCGYFGRREEADEAFAHAIRNQPTPEVYKPAAMNALRMGEPERATELLSYIFKEKVKDDLGYIQVVIDSYQAAGKHTEALALMDKRDEAFPELADDPGLDKARRQSKKYESSGKRLNTVNLIENRSYGSSPGASWGAKLSKFMFPLLLIGGLIAYTAYSWHLSRHAPVWLVNGTMQPYAISVNGSTTTVPGLQARKIEVAEGELAISAPGHEPITHRLSRGFWARPFDRSVTAINPDRVAVLSEEQTTYSSNPPVNPPPKITFGQAVFTMARADYQFEPFPATISMKRNQSITKSRIHQLPTLEPGQYLVLATDPMFGNQANPGLLLKLADAFPEEGLYWNAAINLLPPETYEPVLKKGLSARPLRVECHRAYQTSIERTRPGFDLVPEYRQLHDELNSAESKYLLARVLPDAEGVTLMREAAERVPASPHAAYSLSFRAMALGRFDEAVKWARQAFESNPRNTVYRERYLEALWANEDYPTVREVAAQSQVGLRRSSEIDQYRAAVMENNGEIKQQVRRAAELARMQRGLGGPPLPFDIAEAVVRGDRTKYLALTAAANENQPPANLVIRALLESKPDAAVAVLSQAPSAGRDVALKGLISLAYGNAGDATKAEDWARRMAEDLAKQGRSEREVAAWLTGKKGDAKVLLEALLHPEDKRVVLLVAAGRFPDHAEAFGKLARTLNIQRDEVSLVLDHQGHVK
jgi:tetratricopeptide (TPR) repeat protein